MKSEPATLDAIKALLPARRPDRIGGFAWQPFGLLAFIFNTHNILVSARWREPDCFIRMSTLVCCEDHADMVAAAFYVQDYRPALEYKTVILQKPRPKEK